MSGTQHTQHAGTPAPHPGTPAHGNGQHTQAQAVAATSAGENEVTNLPAPNYMEKEEKFSFRKPTKPNALGEMEEKRAPVTLTLPIPTWDGLVASLRSDQDNKIKNYILSLLEDAVVERARLQVSGDEGTQVNKQEELDVSKLTIEFLANEPRADRRGRGIDKETWEAFEADYVAIMPAITGRTAKQVEVAAGIFAKKLVAVKTNKPVLNALAKRLEEWAANSPSLADFEDIYKYLSGKLETYLKAPDEDLLSAL